MTLNLAAIFGPETSDVPSDRATVSVPLAAVETEEEIAERFEQGDFDINDAPQWDRPFEPSELGSPDDDGDTDTLSGLKLKSSQLGGLCSPPAQPYDPDRLRRLLTICDHCQSAEYFDLPIHSGESARRNCMRCHRFMGWPKWYGKIMTEEG